jgi:hypothetical protein
MARERAVTGISRKTKPVVAIFWKSWEWRLMIDKEKNLIKNIKINL